MSEKYKAYHSFMIGVCFSFLLWMGITLFLVEIPLWKWIIIEICMGLMEYFCNFVKVKLGVEDNIENAENLPKN